ncbi:MAG TPA: phosphohydrolase [Lachnospiraceae bacterium]|jgi:hypothetical protein|nr:phosphohydrolase [Lachnospiraceae bacterium]
MENSGKQERLNALFLKMIAFDEGDPKRIQHFVKVHSFAKLIGELEKLDDHTLYTLEAAAYLHDIGIRIAEEKFGRNDGKLQEREGPEPAGKLMRECGFEKDVISRVQYLIAHHHTYQGIDGQDYQILVEADFLVNLYEDGTSEKAVRTAGEKIFRTAAGTDILKKMFRISD